MFTPKRPKAGLPNGYQYGDPSLKDEKKAETRSKSAVMYMSDELRKRPTAEIIVISRFCRLVFEAF